MTILMILNLDPAHAVRNHHQIRQIREPTAPTPNKSSSFAHGPEERQPQPKMEGKICNTKRKSVEAKTRKLELEAKKRKGKGLKTNLTKGKHFAPKALAKEYGINSSSHEEDNTECIYCQEKYVDAAQGES
ncbi:hypothetical protein FQR65_LT05068 [Abscondita terminalis]|nr:hypothetical protein FQR65_LT05068 [Abscondita terminalis]